MSRPARSEQLLAVVGAHLDGLPLNHELTDRGAVLVEPTTTAAAYRLHRLAGPSPVRPALERVIAGGAAIAVELWAVDYAGLGRLVAGVLPPLGIGSVELAGGRWVRGFICEPYGLVGAHDITAHGGWRSYIASMPCEAGVPPLSVPTSTRGTRPTFPRT